jgi:hypothetical protein
MKPNRRLIGAVVVTAFMLVPLGVFGSSAIARTVSAVGEYGHGHSGSSQYEYKVTLCHHTGSAKHPWHMITVSNRAVAAHLRHHDQLPPCPTTQSPFAHHGDSSDDQGNQDQGNHGHGESSDHGNGKDNGHHGKS